MPDQDAKRIPPDKRRSPFTSHAPLTTIPSIRRGGTKKRGGGEARGFCCNLEQKTLQSPAARAAVTSLGVNIVTSSLMPCMDYITRAIRQCGTSCCSAALDFEVIMRDDGGGGGHA